MKIAFSYEQCEVGHEAVVHQTRKLCPLCEISNLRKERDDLVERMVFLRAKIDAIRNLCEKQSYMSNTVAIADVLMAASGDD